MNEFVYRPQQKREQELIDDFVLRQKEFQKLLDSISSDKKGAAPQHILLQGVRGMGKTTMMYRTFYQVQRDMADQGIVPVIFSEEQYSIRTLYKLWEQIARYLEDHQDPYVGLWQRMQDFQGDDDTYEEHCFELLKAALTQKDHRLVLFIDNFGVMVDKFKKQEQQRFREILISFSGIKIIGGSVVILDSFYAHDKPFFDFFKVMRLEKLGTKEIQTLLLRLDEKHSAKQMPEIIEKQPGRIESLRILTNGVPRTIVLLFDIFLDNVNGNSIEDLRRLMDMVTPLYQHRMDNLPPQQQEIIDTLALNWDGMTTGELAERTRMESKAISAQLKYLEKSGVVHATKSTGKNKFYQLEERFFNIWYLMHHSPRGYRYKVIWLARFLEMWCDSRSLTENIKGFQQKLSSGQIHPEYTVTMLHAYAQTKGITTALRDELVEVARKSMAELSKDVLKKLPSKFSELDEQILMFIESEDYESAYSLVAKSSLPNSLATFLNGYIASESGDYEKGKIYYEQAIVLGEGAAMFNLALLYEDQFKDYEKAKVYYEQAIRIGHIGAMNNLALLYKNQFNDYEKAKTYYEQAIGLGSTIAMNNLALLYEDQFNDHEKAKTYYEQAIGLGSTRAMNNLALLYEDQFSDYEKAKTYYEQAIGLGSTRAMNNLALLYEDQFSDYEKAKTYYEQAIGLGSARAMNNLALLYENQFNDYEKAKRYYEQAFELGDSNGVFNLALLYKNRFKDYEKAEACYEQAMNAGSRRAISNLINLYVSQNLTKKKDQAQKAYKMLDYENDDLKLLNAIRYLFWVEETESLEKKLMSMLIRFKKEFDKWSWHIGDILKFGIAKGYNNLILKLFNLEKFQLKDRFKVIYYALLSLMQDEYPNELKRMPRELEEPVKEMVMEIKALGEVYNQ